jgi:heterotetrameric sarcosine oxidase delta subunit
MLRIECPWCGVRDETEFTYGGESHIARPPPDCDDATWARYLFIRKNLKGPHAERWCHSFGCNQWFNAIRDTLTHDFLAVYRMGQSRPDVAELG